MNVNATGQNLARLNYSSSFNTMRPAIPDPEPEAYPPVPLHGFDLAAEVIPWSILFLIGTLGNTAVLSYVFFITREHTQFLRHYVGYDILKLTSELVFILKGPKTSLE
ncbi:hypothetical protein WR25_13905 [Diploscapter pachys]|uniref:G-protein coupled receptors family 1 profile domain-containing protein n=1 Tax=Diploscapter pachys TaxID=2018661 RepID=A0A2A2K509_9BILA|nr:hypothetical protein WR25_13905 [Diploscapter pachys]